MPYVFLLILLVRALTLEGSYLGVKTFFSVDWEELKKPELWVAAGSQSFFSLGPGWGALMTMSSYSDFNYNFCHAAIWMPVLCAFTSIGAGLSVFGIIGYLLQLSGETDFQSFVQQGPGLSFVVYPSVFQTMPSPQVWNVLFYTMILVVGVDSQFVAVEVVTTAVSDRFPHLDGKHKWKVSGIICFIEFLIGLIFLTEGGFYAYQIVDWYGTPFTVVLIASLEYIAFSYCLGPRRLFQMCNEMFGGVGRISEYIWGFLIFVTGPLGIAFIMFGTFYQYGPPATYKGTKFPTWTTRMGIGIALASILEFPIVACYRIYHHRANLRDLFRPTDKYLAHSREQNVVKEIQTINVNTKIIRVF